MKIYRLNSNINEEMDYEEAIEYLQEEFHFTLDKVTDTESSTAQSEMIEILIDSCFAVEEFEEDEDYYENDLQERESEYRKVQGF